MHSKSLEAMLPRPDASRGLDYPGDLRVLVLDRLRKLGRREFPAMLAERLIRAWRCYLEDPDLMRYSIEAKKFFARGVWRDQRRWPWDQAKIAAVRRAGVGT